MLGPGMSTMPRATRDLPRSAPCEGIMKIFHIAITLVGCTGDREVTRHPTHNRSPLPKVENEESSRG
jgi:hypothetical protein